MEQPPLSKEHVRNRTFEVFFVKVAHWRPFNDGTHLQFSITLRTANGNNSSHFNNQTTTHSPDVQKPIPGLVPMVSDLNLEALGLKAGQRRNSDLENACDDEVPAATDRASSSASKRGKVGDKNSKTKVRTSAIVDQANLLHPGTPSLADRRNEFKGLQLDVAWTLPLDALLRVVLDAHDDGDYITLETAQELYRIQCADYQGPVTAEQKQNNLDGVFKIGNGKGNNKKGEVVAVEDTVPPLSPADDRPPPAAVKKERKKVTMARDDANGSDPSTSKAEEDSNVLTSAPLPGAVFVPNEADTRSLYLELQAAIKIIVERQQAKEARRLRHATKPTSPHGSAGTATGVRPATSPTAGTRSNASFGSSVQ